MTHRLPALAILACSILVIRATPAQADTCSSTGLPAAVYYINGINTGQDDALLDNDILKAGLEVTLGCSVPVILNYNGSFGSPSDLYESVVFKVGLPKDAEPAFWLVAGGAMQKARALYGTLADTLASAITSSVGDAIHSLSFDGMYSQPTTAIADDIALHYAAMTPMLSARRQVVILGHSEGNFFSNYEYNALVREYPVLSTQLGVVAVATPADAVAGDSSDTRYSKFRGDLLEVLNLGLKWNLPALGDLTPFLNPDCARSPLPIPNVACHSMSEYLAESVSWSKISTDIKGLLEAGRLYASDHTYSVMQGESLASPSVMMDSVNPHNLATTVNFIDVPVGFTPLNLDRGEFTYTPPPAFVGSVFIRYRFVTLAGSSNIAAIRIDVTPLPPPTPTARDDTYSLNQGSTLSVPAPGVLANDTYPVGSQVEFLFPLPAGVANANPDGSFVLDLSRIPAFTGTIAFQYVIHAGTLTSNTATVRVTVQPASSQCQPAFADNFNRPNGAVGNGWLDNPGIVNGTLAIRDGALTTPVPVSSSGASVSRSINVATPLTFTATLTQMNGFGGLLKRYSHGVTYGMAADGSGGVEVGFSRGDQNYNDSRVLINGVQYLASFQFGAAINVRITFRPDGSVSGSVSGDGNVFDFTSGPSGVPLAGSNISVGLGSPDTRSSVITNPTIDNLAITYSCLGQSQPPGPPTFTIQDIAIPGEAFALGVAINNAGQVAVNASSTYRAFFWDGTAIHDIGNLGGGFTWATGINAAGHVSGSSFRADGGSRFVIWDGASLHDLAALGGTSDQGNSINDLDQVVGICNTSDIFTQHACFWDGSVVRDLGTNGLQSKATGINNSGQIAGLAQLSNPVTGQLDPDAVIWTDGTAQVIGTGSLYTMAINDSGQVTGWGPGPRAFFWDGSSLRLIDGTYWGRGINALGQVVGNAPSDQTGNTRAFFWDGTTVWDLNNQVVNLAGWTELTDAYGINDLGQITGYGTIGGEVHAFVLTPVPAR